MDSSHSYGDRVAQRRAGIGKFAKQQPEVMKAFRDLNRAGGEARTLDAKTKELISLAIAVALRCDDCIGFHTKACLDAGATAAEIADALGVAIVMGGGPALMYASHAIDAVEEFSADQ